MRFLSSRSLAVGLACLTVLGAQAQGLRVPGAAPAAGGNAAVSRALTDTAAPNLGEGRIRSADYIVAVVDSEPVTNNEVRARMARVEQALASQGGERPPRAALAREVLERLIVEKAQLQLARESGMKVDDYAVNQAMQSVARQNSLDLAEFKRRLAAEGIAESQFREELRSQILLQRLRERDVDGRVRVSEQDIDQYLREQKRGGEGSTTALNLGHILVSVPENASEAVVAERKARAEAAAQQLRSGGELDATARTYSEAREATMGMRPADRYPELFVRAVGDAAVGAVVGPVRSPAGFHVLKVLDKSAAGVSAVVSQNHARHILLRTSEQMSEGEAARRLAELRRRVETGMASFESLAREYSQDGSAREGGDLGWAGPGRYVPEFEEALNALQPGQISQPVVSRFGVHLIQLVERRQAVLTPREQRDMLRDVVRAQKLEKDYATWMQELRGRVYVEYRDPPQ